MKIKDILRLLRPWQWTKNVFVMLPVFFGGALFEPHTLISATTAMVAFCFMASAVYCFNDIFDADADRRHPMKCNRPIASGAVSKLQAMFIMLFMLVVAASILFLLPDGDITATATVFAIYFLMNISYCAWLKRFAIIDVCVVATGFVLRVVAGGVASDVALTTWIVLMTFLLTLFLSFAKRRDDVLRMIDTGEAPRKNTSSYNLNFIDQSLTIIAAVTIVCYILYTVSPEVSARSTASHYLFLTSIFVVLAILRYLQIAVVFRNSGDPTRVILTDRFLQATLAAWFLSFLIILYVL